VFISCDVLNIGYVHHYLCKLFLLILYILWHVDLLLGNDHEIKQFHSNTCTATEERCFLCYLCGNLISRTSEESLKSWLVSWWVSVMLWLGHCDLLLLEAGSWGQGQFGNPEEGECPPLKISTKQQLVETLQTQNTSLCATAVCKL
jgi:hypothetical protein